MRGVIIRDDWAFSLDHPSVAQFLNRVGRAILIEELGQGYFEADFGWRLNPPIPPEFYQFAVGRYPKRNILDVVAYVVSPALKDVHWIILQFYGAWSFCCVMKKEPDQSPEPTAPSGRGSF